jgi:dihydropteroate synthase
VTAPHNTTPTATPGQAADAGLPRPGRCLVIGILNVTPDSFSDGGRHYSSQAAIAHAMDMTAAGADYIDVGGESTRPGAERIPAEEELRRVLPVITELSRRGIAVSIDTTRARIAEAAIEAGAVLVNDVSGGLSDAGMARLIATARVPWVLVHWRGHSRHMYQNATYTNVVADVRRELSARVKDALASGVATEQLILDPGLGFAKHPQHDLALLANLNAITSLGYPVLVGASRKRFLTTILTGAGILSPTLAQRDTATLATTILAAHAGAWAVRVHDVPATVNAIHVLTAVSCSSLQTQVCKLP